MFRVLWIQSEYYLHVHVSDSLSHQNKVIITSRKAWHSVVVRISGRVMSGICNDQSTVLKTSIKSNYLKLEGEVGMAVLKTGLVGIISTYILCSTSLSLIACFSRQRV